MAKKQKNPVSIEHFKNKNFQFPEKKPLIEILKSKVKPNQKLMVAVSGGSDSILTACLVYNFFLEEKYSLQNLFFIHCNHTTRKGNSDDERFIRQFFANTQLIVTQRPISSKTTEAELRKRRYEQFKTYCKRYHIDQLVLGHNLTDRIECTFLNLLRGANINGFLAIQQQESHHLIPDIHVIRPILGLEKKIVMNICEHLDLPFVTDPTNNDSTTSLRNKLRNSILPELYALAHKKTGGTNSFIKSFKNIYAQLDQHQPKETISLTTIPQSPHRHSTAAYQRNISPHDITIEKIVEVTKKLGIYNNVTTPLLKERTDFFKNKESGYKYFKGTYGFISHKKIYFITGPKLFWQKKIDTSRKITTLGDIKREGKIHSLTSDEQKNAILRFPNAHDTYKNKTRNEWCINQKIPIFRRNFIPILVKKNQIIKIFKN